MLFKSILCTVILLAASCVGAEVATITQAAFKGLAQSSQKIPYSGAIEVMQLGFDEKGVARVGIASREIKTFEKITGVIVVHKTETGFKIHEAYFPDITKIRSAKERNQVASILKMFKNQPFDPHVEKSAVDGLTGATKYGLRVSGYFNYMARKTALEMEANPDWPRTPIK